MHIKPSACHSVKQVVLLGREIASRVDTVSGFGEKRVSSMQARPIVQERNLREHCWWLHFVEANKALFDPHGEDGLAYMCPA